MNTISELKNEIKQFPRGADGRIQYTLDFKLRVIEAHKASRFTAKMFAHKLGMPDQTALSRWARSLTPDMLEDKSVSVTRLRRKPSSTALQAIEGKRNAVQAEIKTLMTELDKLNDAAKLLKELGL